MSTVKPMHEPRPIALGLLNTTPAWRSLLDQIGMPWSTVDSPGRISNEYHSVIIANRSLSSDEAAAVHAYLVAGGAVIYTPESGKIVTQRARSTRFTSSLSPGDQGTYQTSDILDLFDRVSLFPGHRVIDLERTGAGTISYLGLSIDRLLRTAPSLRKSFYMQRERLPHEMVARRSRGAIRQVIQSHLEVLHHQRGLPFIHTWSFPRALPTIFTFRIDSDKGTQAQIDEIAALSRRYSIPTTWFLDVKSHESWLEHFRSFDGQEIAVHCYEHRVTNSSELNAENFGKAAELMRRAGLTPRGMAAPTGAWNDALGEAIQQCGFEYSSEFSYAYDDLPSFPVVRGAVSPVLQIPMHPMCIGTLRRERMTTEEMTAYFLAVSEQKRRRREPINLYHHPGHETNSVFEGVFQYIATAGIACFSYVQVAEWWKRRHAARFSVSSNGGSVTIDRNGAAEDVFIRISMPGNKETITGGTSVELASLPVYNGEPPRSIPADIMRSRTWTFRQSLQTAIDWWITTTE